MPADQQVLQQRGRGIVGTQATAANTLFTQPSSSSNRSLPTIKANLRAASSIPPLNSQFSPEPKAEEKKFTEKNQPDPKSPPKFADSSQRKLTPSQSPATKKTISPDAP